MESAEAAAPRLERYTELDEGPLAETEPRYRNVGYGATSSPTRLVTWEPSRVTAALLVVPRARVVNENAAHHPRGHGEEVRAVMPCHGLAVDQADIGLVDESRRLEAVPHTLARHAGSRDAMELVVDERNQLLEGALVALSPSEQQSGDLRVVGSNPCILGPFNLWSPVPAS
jgi:hypothetical protein